MAFSKLANRVSNFRERIEARKLAKDSNGGYITPDLKTAIKQKGIQAVIEQLEHSYYLRTDKREVTLTLGNTRKTYTGLTAEKLRYGKFLKIGQASKIRHRFYDSCIRFIDSPKFTNHITFGSGIKTRRKFVETIFEALKSRAEIFWGDDYQTVGIIIQNGKIIVKQYDQRTIKEQTPKVRNIFEVDLNQDELNQFIQYNKYTQYWQKELDEYRQGVWEIK
jgi:hypothetical protein